MAGLAVAAAALVPLRAVAALAPTANLRRAWTWLTFAILFCFLARSAAAFGRLRADVSLSDVLDASVHVVGPGFVLGVAWLSLRTGRELVRLGGFERMAFEDPLTSLGNRRAFDARLGLALAESHGNGSTVLLVVIDVDRFKQVNDRFGHDAGDRVLCTLAQAIGGKDRENSAFRLGGDEFAVVLVRPDRSRAGEALEDLRRAVGQAGRVRWGTSRVGFTASLGAAAAGQDETPEALFRRADQALYDAKRGGRATSIAA